MGVRSALLFLERVANLRAAACLYKAWTALVRSYSAAQARHHSVFQLCVGPKPQLEHQRMKHRRLLLSLPHLPTITETLEDLPVHPSSTPSPAGSQSQEDYMSSIQALARPAEPPSWGPVRLQRAPRLRQLCKAQMKLSASSSAPRGSPRTLRTPRAFGLNQTEDFSLRMSRERDCRGKDPVDWLFGQIRT